MLRASRSCFHGAVALGAAAAALAVGLLVSTSTGCLGCEGGACKDQGVFVGFVRLTPRDVVSFTASGVCGPVPSVLCNPALTECTAAQSQSFWGVQLPATAAGPCSVHVVLDDGEIFDESVQITQSTGSCCPGFYADKNVSIGYGGGTSDASAGD